MTAGGSDAFFIDGGRVLIDGGLVETSLRVEDGVIAAIGRDAGTGARVIDARGLLVMPGIVDIHGDAFERQIMPRPGVDFPIALALADSDRQAIANGITTVFHATTWSWEPGLRGAENARRLVEAIEALRPRLRADTRFHLRHETFNIAAEDEIAAWIAAGRVNLLAFNDHTDGIIGKLARPDKAAPFLARSGLGHAAFEGLAKSVASRGADVPASIARLAAAARAAGVAMLSHDDSSPATRRAMRALGVAIAEFPVNEETAREAVAGGDFTVFGAPNVLRGGSHTGWTKAADMIAKDLCSILASDYYYPAPLLAPFRLAADGIASLDKAWSLVSSHPARAAGLADRGRLAAGFRADILLVDDREPPAPCVVAVLVAGRLVQISEAARLGAAHGTAT